MTERMDVDESGFMRVLTLYCTIYDFCERNFEGLWDLRELLLLLFSCVSAFWATVFTGLHLHEV